VTLDDGPPPEEVVALGDSVGLALLTVLDSLRPDERLAFVLHDVFAVPFAEIGIILGKSADATKMLASRARGKVQDAQRPASAGRQRREVVQAFLAAARDGQFERLLQVLHPEVKFTVHTPDGTFVTLGATEVATRARVAGSAARGHAATVDGLPGVISWSEDGIPPSLLPHDPGLGHARPDLGRGLDFLERAFSNDDFSGLLARQDALARARDDHPGR
jgi:RNA polymerase sigma-70 factor (ECF subfamily)